MRCIAGLAQLVEHLICNQRVGGSSPSTGTIRFRLRYSEIALASEDVGLEKRMSRCNEQSECKRTNSSMFYVYILQSINSPEHFYVGYTSDLKERLSAHNSGNSIHTNKFKPWALRGYIAFDSEEKARNFESFLKTGNGRIFQKKFF